MSIDLANARATLQWQGISVGVVALVASAALVFANALTQGPIAEAEARDLQASLAQVLPAGFADNDLLKDTLALADADCAKTLVYLSKKNGRQIHDAQVGKVVSVWYPWLHKSHPEAGGLLWAGKPGVEFSESFLRVHRALG